MVVLIDDFEVMREFPIRNCKRAKFSSNGHTFAAVNGQVIQVFSSVSFHNVFNLKGHNGKVRMTNITNVSGLFNFRFRRYLESLFVIYILDNFLGVVSKRFDSRVVRHGRGRLRMEHVYWPTCWRNYIKNQPI